VESEEAFLDKIDKINEIVGGSGKAVAGYWWLVFVAAVCDRWGLGRHFRRSQISAVGVGV